MHPPAGSSCLIIALSCWLTHNPVLPLPLRNNAGPFCVVTCTRGSTGAISLFESRKHRSDDSHRDATYMSSDSSNIQAVDERKCSFACRLLCEDIYAYAGHPASSRWQTSPGDGEGRYSHVPLHLEFNTASGHDPEWRPLHSRRCSK